MVITYMYVLNFAFFHPVAKLCLRTLKGSTYTQQYNTEKVKINEVRFHRLVNHMNQSLLTNYREPPER